MTRRSGRPPADGMAVVGTCWWCAAHWRMAQVSPEETLKSFELADGLEATVWATEPMLVNPTNIDIDARGRVWVLRGGELPQRRSPGPEGDRIVILEDTDHDGKADSAEGLRAGPGARVAAGHRGARQQGVRVAVAEHAGLHDRRDPATSRSASRRSG